MGNLISRQQAVDALSADLRVCHIGIFAQVVEQEWKTPTIIETEDEE